MSHRPPVDEQVRNARRSLVLIASTALLVAALLGYLLQPHEQLPMDPGSPVTVTTTGP